MVKILNYQRPPNFKDIVKVFPRAARPGIIFAYGDSIYVPSGDALTPELLAHETVHCQRQREMGVENWWQLYLESPSFRYEEELLAHRAEYQALIGPGSNRQQRRGALQHIAKKLTAPLYGCMVSLNQALVDLEAGATVHA